MVEEFITAQTRQAKASESLEKDKRSKQYAANQIYAEKIKAENEGNTDLAAKLTRDYKEKIHQAVLSPRESHIQPLPILQEPNSSCPSPLWGNFA